MKTVPVSELFEISTGTSLSLLKLERTNKVEGIPFVSATGRNNGVSAYVKKLDNIVPLSPGNITVAMNGSVMSSFVQLRPYYSIVQVYSLTSKEEMSLYHKLYYCQCFFANKFRFSYGRVGTVRTLGGMGIPHPDEIPSWVNSVEMGSTEQYSSPALSKITPTLDVSTWGTFNIPDLFCVKRGATLSKLQRTPGMTSFVSATAFNNGVTDHVGQRATHDGNTISVSNDGSIGEAFYQKEPFFASPSVTVLYPKFSLNPHLAMFLTTILRQEKFKYNYGRKWNLERMNTTSIKLPVTPTGDPDWEYMERYIKTLPFSSQL